MKLQFFIVLAFGLCGVLASGCSTASANEPAAEGPQHVPVECWATAADGSYTDFDQSVAHFENCTTDEYSFAVVNPAMGEIRCFRDDGFCPLENPALSRAAVRLTGFAAGAARGEIGSRHQISNVSVVYESAELATVSFRSTAYYFNEDGSFELGWGDHTIEVVEQDGVWKIRAEDVFIPSANRRIVADAHEAP